MDTREPFVLARVHGRIPGKRGKIHLDSAKGGRKLDEMKKRLGECRPYASAGWCLLYFADEFLCVRCMYPTWLWG
jgi:hypothetical protein